jgi:Flp pilus assembly pilin Flp
MEATALLREMLLDDEGATLVEYALVLAAFSVVAVLALAAFGGETTQGLSNDGQLLTTSGETPP